MFLSGLCCGVLWQQRFLQVEDFGLNPEFWQWSNASLRYNVLPRTNYILLGSVSSFSIGWVVFILGNLGLVLVISYSAHLTSVINPPMIITSGLAWITGVFGLLMILNTSIMSADYQKPIPHGQVYFQALIDPVCENKYTSNMPPKYLLAEAGWTNLDAVQTHQQGIIRQFGYQGQAEFWLLTTYDKCQTGRKLHLKDAFRTEITDTQLGLWHFNIVILVISSLSLIISTGFTYWGNILFYLYPPAPARPARPARARPRPTPSAPAAEIEVRDIKNISEIPI